MRYARPLSIVGMLLLILSCQGVYGSEPCFFPTWSRPISAAGSRIEVHRPVVSTPYIVERPTIVSESIPIQIGPPIRETILSYETPVVLSTSSSVTTMVSNATTFPAAESRIVADRPEWKPRESRLVSLQPDSSVEFADHLAADQRSSQFSETSPADSKAIPDLKLPEMPDRAIVMRPPPTEEATSKEKTLEPLSEPPKRNASSRLSIPPPIPMILGQAGSSFSNDLEEALSQPPPLPQGPVDPKVIPSKLVNEREEPPNVLDSDFPAGVARDPDPGKPEQPRRNASAERYSFGDSSINGILLITTIISVMALIYMIFIAIDYHQRWIQSLTSQNGVFASSWNDDGYGGSEDFDVYGKSSYGADGLDGSRIGGGGAELFGRTRYSGYGGDV